MATISGKRFQITDGASSPTNLFPYTVTEAVYGLSTVIENAKSSVTSVLSAVTLNGVSKEGTTASFYAPTTSGTTGQILKATTIGAPVWTSAALGASNKPIYLNSSGVLTEGVSCITQSSSAYQTVSVTSTSAGYALALKSGMASKSYLRFDDSSGILGWLGVESTNGVVYITSVGATRTIYHSGNSNKSDVAWTASILYAGRLLTNGSSSDAGFWRGSLFSSSLAAGSIAIASDSTNDPIVFLRGNVGIGTVSPGAKLDVAGQARFQCGYFSGTNPALGALATGTIRINASESNGARANYGLYSWVDFSEGKAKIQVGREDGRTQTYALCLQPLGGNVGIGTSSPAHKLDVTGDIASTGDQVVSSDLTLKTNLQDVTYSVKDIAKCRAVTFDWKDGRGKSAGSIAQDWKPLIPELVHGEEGNMTLAYGQIALVNTIIEAREIEILKKRVKELEAEVNRLRS